MYECVNDCATHSVIQVIVVNYDGGGEVVK